MKRLEKVSISMMNIVFTTASIILLMQILASGADSMTAKDLLERYNEALAVACENIAFDIEASGNLHGDSRITTRRRAVQRMGSHMLVALDSETRERDDIVDSSDYKTLTTDQNLFSYQTHLSEPILLIRPSQEVPFSERIRSDMGICTHIEGSAWDGKTIIEAMQQASSLQLRDSMEAIGGHQTYVLEAQGRENTYILWIDPEYGFNPRRIEMIKYRDGRRELPESQRHLIVDDINLEKIDGKYLIMSAGIRYEGERYEGGTIEIDCTVKRTNVHFNPDFSKAVKEFWQGVPEGVSVAYDDVRGIQGVQYEWVNGQVRSKVGDTFMDQLEESINTVKADSSAQVIGDIVPSEDQTEVDTSNKVSVDITDENTVPEAQQDRTFLKWAMLLLVGFSVVGIGVLIIVRRKRVDK